MGTVEGVEISGATHDRVDEVLTPRALELIARLDRELNPRRLELLAARQERVRAPAEGGTLGFLPETADIREDAAWQVVYPATGLEDRRVEITGPTVMRELVEKQIDEEMAAIAEARGEAFAGGRWDDARALFTEMALADEYADFLTLPAYERMP
jgi:malate synthase